MNFNLIADAIQIVKSAALHIQLTQVKAQAEAVLVGLEEHKYSPELATIKSQVAHLRDIAAQAEAALKQVNEAVEAAKAVTEKTAQATTNVPAPEVKAPVAPAPVAPVAPAPTPVVPVAPAVVPTADTIASGTATEEPISSPGEPKIVK